ncbi:MAG TPA: DPP IV N-terminal domain-containing protein [Gemmatimonadales bacterium]|nr:DPP IV N-terminal domain-containing protein [Gemmatimonadales bacterium]
MRRVAFALAIVCAPAAAAAQSFPLTVESIMRGPDLVGTAPSNVRFSADGRYVYFTWRAPGVDTLDRDYRVATRATPGQPERLPRLAVDTIAMADGAWSPDLRREIVVLKGNLWLVERSGAKRRLTETPVAASDPGWSADGQWVFFTREHNAWALNVANGGLRQLTDIRPGPAPKRPDEPMGQKKFLRDQQRELFDFIRRQVAAERLRADTDTVHTAKPLYLGERQAVTRLAVAPDARFVLLTLTERPKGDTVEGSPGMLARWVTQSGYVEAQQLRTKVGDAELRQKAAVIDVATGKATWLDSTIGTGERDVEGVGISPDGRHALVRAAATNFKDAWLAVIDLPALVTRVVAHLHDDAWLDGPLAHTAGWLHDGETVYYGSEATGYAHLYTVSAGGGTPRALTRGEWEVHDVELSPDGKTFYLHTNEGDFGQVHCYALDVATGRMTQLTTAEGRQDVVVSPDATTLAVLHSTANHPPNCTCSPTGPAPRCAKSPKVLRLSGAASPGSSPSW